MKENEFQMKLKKKIKKAVPGSVVLKNSPNGILGIPDLTVLGPNGKYAILECKRASNSSIQALQDHYIEQFNKMAYARFVSPVNEEEVIEDLKRILGN